MNEPTVCCVCLTADRPEMTRQAVECFRAQTYPAKKLLIYNSGESDEIDCGCGTECFHVLHTFPEPQTIGHLRNLANSFRTEYGHDQSDIVIHFDSDDYSHPNRIAEQVALLQSSGGQCVGYNSMLFWDEPRWIGKVSGCQLCGSTPCICEGEAWLYTHPSPRYALGTSLCYWRSAWEAHPFEATSHGEDRRFLRALGDGVVSTSSLIGSIADHAPRMVARIHGGNTGAYQREQRLSSTSCWQRAAGADEFCRSVFA